MIVPIDPNAKRRRWPLLFMLDNAGVVTGILWGMGPARWNA